MAATVRDILRGDSYEERDCGEGMHFCMQTFGLPAASLMSVSSPSHGMQIIHTATWMNAALHT